MLVASSLKSTFTVTSPVVPDTSIAVPATTLVTLASVYPVPMLVPCHTPVATVPSMVIAVLDPISKCTGAPLPSATTIFPSVSPTNSVPPYPSPTSVPCQVPDAIVPTAVIWVCEASTFSTPLLADNPVPATAVITSAILSFLVPLLSLASTMAMLSLATATAASVRLLRSAVSVATPLVAPPANPELLAVTMLVMSPTSGVDQASVPSVLLKLST